MLTDGVKTDVWQAGGGGSVVGGGAEVVGARVVVDGTELEGLEPDAAAYSGVGAVEDGLEVELPCPPAAVEGPEAECVPV